MSFTSGEFCHPVSPACNTCKHFIDFSMPPRCAAYKAIPKEILTGDDDHRQPSRGDHGVQWEPIEKSE